MAVASFLDARSRRGKWLLRIDDLDSPRVSKDAELQIVDTLAAHGLNWDDHILHQQDHIERYRDSLATLINGCQVFSCTCSRKDIDRVAGCVSSCRFNRISSQQPHSIRIHMLPQAITFHDRVQGKVEDQGALERNIAIWRRDGLPTYPLSVIVDDSSSCVTHVVRGADLLANTAHQIFLQQQLGLDSMSFAHLPVLNERTGIKLSKRDASTAVDNDCAKLNLVWSLQLLGMDPPQRMGIDSLLEWGVDNWNIERVPVESEMTDFVSV